MTILKLGSRGAEVKILQEKLNLKADGVFGPLTEAKVKEFQKANGLKVDGIVGKNTWDKLSIQITTNTSSNSRNITEIIVHCEATPEGEEFSRATLEACHAARKFSAYKYNASNFFWTMVPVTNLMMNLLK